MTPDLIVLNADVRTMDVARPRAGAVAVAQGRILALGSDDLRDLAGPGTRIVDAGGRLCLPGFLDAHVHLADGGHGLIASGRLFTTVTAVVVGGTALSGGVGSVLNSVVGVLIVVVLTNGMVLMGVPPFVQQGVQGLLIIVAVSLALDRRLLSVVK